MSTHSQSSLLSETETQITSYDIPLQGLSSNNDVFYENLLYLETTAFVNDHYQQDGNTSVNPIFNHDQDDAASAMSHGFFLGKESLPNLTVPGIEEPDDEDEEEDEGIGGIYRSSHDPDAWVRRSDRSFTFKTSPEPTPRHALSQRIGNIGVIGQNIALGHRLGVLTEDASLIPKRVQLHTSHFVITEDSPVQTDVTWSKPVNASSFVSLIYKIEVNLADDNDIDIDCEGDENWQQLPDVRSPVFRVYHVEDKLFIGKLRIARRKSNIVIKVRIRSNGELVLPDRKHHWIMSAYSEIAEVTFAGYDYIPAENVELEIQQTHL